VLFAAVTVLWGVGPPAYAADTGFVGPFYGFSTVAPTGQKPQSKLWVAGGIWWGALFDKVSASFHIFRYDWAANSWSDTGALIDERTNVYMDALWDGAHLYIVSAGTSASNSTHSPRLIRFSYQAVQKVWSRDTGYPITPMGNGGVEAAVIAKDSTGLLWATYTQGSKVYVVHSTAGHDQTWVPRYQVPTPAQQSKVAPDDISAIVAYDGNKIGVLWSNQILGIETMYWAWHQDGTSDQAWNLQVAYQQPKGADDHMNLKSLVGDPSGRVFAAAKTSMTGSTDPLINLLVLNPAGQWSATKVWSVKDQGTRAIVQIDTQARELYVFGAAPCCAGGTIYYKKTGLDNPTFAPGLGTPFIHSDAHPEANNATSTKQNLNGTTGLLVMAGDDSTRTYLYNRLPLGGTPTDTTPPNTTITSAPASTTTSTVATFAFTSNEAGSTFTCKLDNAAAAACTSPKSYTGLAVGGHTFTVTATDPAGNTDPTPATYSWAVNTASIFSDDFSSGGFTLGGWAVGVGADGSATVISGAVQPADLGARMVSSSLTGSTASIRKTFAAPQPTLTITWDARVVQAGSTQTFALAKLYGSSGRVLTLERVGSSGSLSVRDVGTTTIPTGTSLPLDVVARLTLTVVQGTTDTLTLSVNGVVVYTSSTVDLGSSAFTSLRIGDDSTGRSIDHRVDNIQVNP